MQALLYQLNGHFAGRLLTTLVTIGATLQSYFWLNNHLPSRFDFSTPLDAAIPFLPWTYGVYVSFFALLLATAWLLEAREFLRMLAAVLVVNAAKNLQRSIGAQAALARYPFAVCPTALADRAAYLDAALEGRGVGELKGAGARDARAEVQAVWRWIVEQMETEA